jgi:hypothetical protein
VFLIIAAAFALAYWLGWLPPSLVVPVLFACSFLGRTPHRRRSPRGLYLPPPGSGTLLVSPMPKAATRTPLVTRIAEATSRSHGEHGEASAAEATRRLRALPSNATALTSYGIATQGGPVTGSARGASGLPPEAAA